MTLTCNLFQIRFGNHLLWHKQISQKCLVKILHASPSATICLIIIYLRMLHQNFPIQHCSTFLFYSKLGSLGKGIFKRRKSAGREVFTKLCIAKCLYSHRDKFTRNSRQNRGTSTAQECKTSTSNGRASLKKHIC